MKEEEGGEVPRGTPSGSMPDWAALGGMPRWEGMEADCSELAWDRAASAEEACAQRGDGNARGGAKDGHLVVLNAALCTREGERACACNGGGES